MSKLMKYASVAGLVVGFCFNSIAGEAGPRPHRPKSNDDGNNERPERPRPPPHGPISFILHHADDLKLTADQKEKLLALGKSLRDRESKDGNKEAKGEEVKNELRARIDEILTDEQKAKLKDLREKEVPPPPHGKRDAPPPKKD